MKKVVLAQRFQFYAIEPYKDYTSLEKKRENEVRKELDLGLSNIDFFETLLTNIKDGTESRVKFKGGHKIRLFNKKELKKKNTKYFYSNELEGEQINLDNWNPSFPTFYTTKERHLLKHYGRPLSSVSVEIQERNITVDEDTISVRFYVYKKSRVVNCKFFKKTRTALGFKINFKTGNVISYEGTEKPKIRQNNFKHLSQVLNQFFGRTAISIIYIRGNDSDKDHPINKEANNVFNDDEFMKCLFHSILSKIPHNANIISNTELNIRKKMLLISMETFISVNKIKVPNDYKRLLMEAYPTKHFLKKNDNKLVAAILDRIGIKSKSTIRLLHKFPKIDISKLILMARYFGYDDLHKYIHNINEKYWGIPKEKGIFSDDSSIYFAMENKHIYDIKDSEKSCLLKLINEFIEKIDTEDDGYKSSNSSLMGNSIVRSQFGAFNDHLDMLIKIRRFLPNIEMRANNLSDFHNEHLELAKLDRQIKKGYSIKYVFEDKLIKHIEKPIIVKNLDDEIMGTFYPVLLKIDGEYTEEGGHMHHCVASYADKEKSIIVSLREDNVLGNERVTCEYDVRDKGCVQEKYFCNAKPPERFETALVILQDRILAYKGSIKSISKERIPLVINGVQLAVKEENLLPNFLDF
jgi:hypothetical protein